jgi:hypothetical protein
VKGCHVPGACALLCLAGTDGMRGTGADGSVASYQTCGSE